MFLIGNENIGIKGAAIGNIICNATVCFIGYVVLIKNVKLNLKKDIIKIFLATFFMAIMSKCIYFLLKRKIFLDTALVISIMAGIGFYSAFFGMIELIKNIKIKKSQ